MYLVPQRKNNCLFSLVSEDMSRGFQPPYSLFSSPALLPSSSSPSGFLHSLDSYLTFLFEIWIILVGMVGLHFYHSRGWTKIETGWIKPEPGKHCYVSSMLVDKLQLICSKIP
jgi:hypothetical protein